MSSSVQSVIVGAKGPPGGTLEVPGDKSISHRVAMLSALASGTSVITGFLQSEDCMNTLGAMKALGARVSFSSEGVLTIEGTKGKLMQPAGPLDLGNSGTGMRLLAGLLAGHPLCVEMTGDESLRSRPMRRISVPLEKMGARIELLGPNGCAPIRVTGGRLRGIEYELPVASAQVKSCVLLAGLFAEGETAVIEPAPTRDHTERVLQAAGVPVRVEGHRIEVEGHGPRGPALKGRHWQVPGDFSSAAFFFTAAAGCDGAELTVRNVGLNPRRIGLLGVLERMGARIRTTLREAGEAGEPAGDVSVTGARLHGVEVGGDEIPGMIAELPLVAVAAAVAEGVTVIRDAAELRVKESDRIATMAENLRRMGVKVEEREDGMVVHGAKRIAPEESLRSHGDHRVAMAMAVLALHAVEPVCISNVACVNTSYPGFWDDLKRAGAHVR